MAPRMEARALAYEFDEIAPLVEATASSQRSEGSEVPRQEEERSPSWREQIEAFVFEYGLVGICTHSVLSVLWFGSIYAGIASGVAVSAALLILGFTDSLAADSAGSFILTFSIYKALTPVRWTVTLAAMPAVVRMRRLVRNMRVPVPMLRPSPSSERLLSLA